MAVTVKGPPVGLRTITCAGCSYILEYAPKDVQHQMRSASEDGWDIERDAYDYITCPRPECRKQTTLPKPDDGYDLTNL